MQTAFPLFVVDVPACVKTGTLYRYISVSLSYEHRVFIGLKWHSKIPSGFNVVVDRSWHGM